MAYCCSLIAMLVAMYQPCNFISRTKGKNRSCLGVVSNGAVVEGEDPCAVVLLDKWEAKLAIVREVVVRTNLVYCRAEGTAVIIAYAVLRHSVDFARPDVPREREALGIAVLVLAVLVVRGPLKDDASAAQH